VDADRLFAVAGDCQILEGCFITVVSYNGYAFNYRINATCTITVLADTVLDVMAFSTASTDHLNISGSLYSGANGPQGVNVSKGTVITFVADANVTSSGFFVCGSVGETTNNDTHASSKRIRIINSE
jgi:hypothetical protein